MLSKQDLENHGFKKGLIRRNRLTREEYFKKEDPSGGLIRYFLEQQISLKDGIKLKVKAYDYDNDCMSPFPPQITFYKNEFDLGKIGIEDLNKFIEKCKDDIYNTLFCGGIEGWSKKMNYREEGNFYEKLVEIMKPKEGSLILDEGCGEGYFQEKLNTNSVGVDIIDQYLRKAKKRNVNVVKSTVTHLPFIDNVFDESLISLLLYNFDEPKRKETLKETHRTLKNKGKLVVVEDKYSDLKYWEKFLLNNGFEAKVKKDKISRFWFPVIISQRIDNIDL